MRWSVQICVLAVICTSLVACSTAPREPARVDYRNADRYSSGPSRTVHRSCQSGTYVVQRGDTLSQIAESCGVAMRALADANGLYAPYTLNRGQTLSMPRAALHVVQRGENLYRIGLRYNVGFQELAAFNHIRAPYELEVGQQIRLPGGSSVPGSSSRDTSVSRRAESTRTASTRREPASSSAPNFDWPVRGRLLSGFGRKPEGGRNDGINIEVREGESVRAAASGQVVYAGSELAGYGRLVLIRHSGGYVTAYAHNSNLMVSEGDQIERGQVIARAGSTGTVDSSQVHFEIRRGVNPEDPMRHLN
jgi:murein DD-endopeptidase MepM/ murein hydrolase activator NlpD